MVGALFFTIALIALIGWLIDNPLIIVKFGIFIIFIIACIYGYE